ncbi:MAG TPA: NUDIX domain-containing protein [Ktedonobacteraceae bacterium]|nr:NUDIX domain-containing protein [Ktedonobacteraceae bacterium]
MLKRPFVGIGVIVRDGDRILLIKRQNSHGDGTWSIPGGHLEYGESFEECALREVEEETGVIVADATFCAITNDIFVKEEKHYITIWIEARYVSGEACINAPREMSDINWFPWNALPTPLFLPIENLLAQGFSLRLNGSDGQAGPTIKP